MNMITQVFDSEFKHLIKDYDLRLDSKFYDLFTKHADFSIIPSSYATTSLKDILKPDYEEYKFETDKMYKGILTDSDFFDEEGNIIDEIEISKDNHPDRLKYKAHEEDIIIPNLKGAKATVVLVNKKVSNHVWSNGFYILKNVSQSFETKFLYYLLRSKMFRELLDDNLSRGIGLPSYYERDLLRLRIPIVPKEIQKEVVAKIELIEREIEKIKKTIPDMQQLINATLAELMSCYPNKLDTETQIFNEKFSMISSKRNLRADPKYLLFWNKTNGEIFMSDKIPNKKLRKLVSSPYTERLEKGEYTKYYFLVDTEDIEPKTGVILNKNKVNKVESTKIIFGNADLLISKLRPYLGHVFINEKKEELIGTTEFIPYIVDESQIKKEFLECVLLSSTFLAFVIYLQYGKEHPRITNYDLESIEIPLPSVTDQIAFLKSTNDKIGDLKQKREELEKYRKGIELLLIETLKG